MEKHRLKYCQYLKMCLKPVFCFNWLKNRNSGVDTHFIGYDPKLEISAVNGCVKIKSGTCVEFENVKPSEYIRKILKENYSIKL